MASGVNGTAAPVAVPAAGEGLLFQQITAETAKVNNYQSEAFPAVVSMGSSESVNIAPKAKAGSREHPATGAHRNAAVE